MRSTEFNAQSPEDVYTALRLVYPRDWINPTILIALVLWVIGFLIFGRIPVTGSGNAMFLSRDTVVPIQSMAVGQIKQWKVNIGENVKRGQLLAELDQPILSKQLEQARQQLKDAQDRNGVVEKLAGSYVTLEQESIKIKGKTAADRIQGLTGELSSSKQLARVNREETSRVLAKQEKNLASMQSLEKDRLAELQDKLARTEELRKQSLRSDDDVLAARQAVSDQRVRLADLGVQVIKLQLERIQGNDAYLQSLNRLTDQKNDIVDLQRQLEEKESQFLSIRQTYNQAKFIRQSEEAEMKRNIERLQRELEENRCVYSAHSGRILELTAGRSEFVTRGQRLGAIDTRVAGSQLQAVAYFKLKDGKRIKPGMQLRLTPATTERERFGSLLAEVTSVSSYPVSTEGVAKVVGNSTVAAALTKDGNQIEVLARPLADASSQTGYLWDISEGPEAKVSFGTQATALVNLEQRAPITFVIPMLRHSKVFAKSTSD